MIRCYWKTHVFFVWSLLTVSFLVITEQANAITCHDMFNFSSRQFNQVERFEQRTWMELI